MTYAILPVTLGTVPRPAEGSKMCQIPCEWAQVLSQSGNDQYLLTINLLQQFNSGQFTTIQSAFIDNSQCQYPVIFTSQGTGQVLFIPAYTQGMYQLIVGPAPIFTAQLDISGASFPIADAVTTNIWLLNTLQEPWNCTVLTSNTVGGSVPITTFTYLDPATGAVTRQLTSKIAETALALTDFGADPTGAVTCDAAWSAFVAQVCATGRPGYIPAGTFTFAGPATLDFGQAPVGQARFYGAGLGRAVLSFPNTIVGTAMQFTVSTGAGFYGAFTDVSIHASSSAGSALAIGNSGLTDAFNSYVFDIEVKNSYQGSNAIGLSLNTCYNCDIRATANTGNSTNGGIGTALMLRQSSFNRIFGSFSNATYGVHIGTGYSFGNIFHALDIEVVNTCVLIDITTANQNTFIGGQFVWTNNANAGIGVAINGTAGGNNRFIGMNLASRGTNAITSGVIGIIIYGGGTAVGTEYFGNAYSLPVSGDAVVGIQPPSGNNGNLYYLSTVAGSGSLRWGITKNNATESGSNVGSDLIITRYDDSANAIDNPFYITRSTGVTNISHAELGAGSGGTLGFYGASLTTKPTVTGAKAGNAALTSLLSTLATLGLITDSTS